MKPAHLVRTYDMTISTWKQAAVALALCLLVATVCLVLLIVLRLR